MTIRFFHSFEHPAPIQGTRPIDEQKHYADIIFRYPVSGKTVLDIGAWDGYFSFEAERRGASRVLATDHFCWSGPGWGTKDGFNYIHQALKSKVESVDVDVVDLDNKKLGTFDFVMMLGVLYHLKDPFGGLEKVAAMTSDCLVIETLSDMNDVNEPVARYYLFDEFGGDPTNYWGPNILCLESMLRELGFTRFEHECYPQLAKNCRVIMHAWK